MHSLTSLITFFIAAPAVSQAALVSQFVYNSHTYQLWSDARTFASASAFAQSQMMGGQNGYLARIDSAAENAALFMQIQANVTSFTNTASDGGGSRYIWLGDSDAASEGNWIWQQGGDQFWQGGVMGNSSGGFYSNWGSSLLGNEPDDFTNPFLSPNGQDGLAMAIDAWPIGNAGQWNDISQSNNMPFIVEFNAIPEPAMSLLIFAGSAVMLIRRSRRTSY